MEDRRLNIEQALPDTGIWLFKCNKYRRWMCREDINSHNGFLWIKAKPGAGKSTLMKQILQSFQSRRESKQTVAAYFFNARGISALENSRLGLFRTLLHQLIDQVPALCHEIKDLYASKVKEHSNDWAWHVTELQQLLTFAILQSRGLEIFLLVDALDECNEEDVREVVAYFEKLCCTATDNDVLLGVLFASRHYPHISVEKVLELNLDHRAERMKDISRYVKRTLKIKRAKGLAQEITQRSAGVFLWTVLVVKRLNKAYDDGQEHKLWQILQTIPIGLDELFAELFDTAVDSESIVILQWVSFSVRALTPIELFLAVLSGTNPGALQAEDRKLLMDSSSIERFILSSSRGLIHIVKTEGDQTRHVEFIHESVKDFLLGSKGLLRLKTIQTHSNLVAQCHEELKSWCINYLKYYVSVSSQEMPCKTAQSIPTAQNRSFLTYAASNTLRHAYIAEVNGISQENLNSHLGLQRDRILHLVANCEPLLESYLASRPHSLGVSHESRVFHEPRVYHELARDVPHLYIATGYSIISWMRALIKAGSDINVRSEEYGYPLLAAAAQGNMVAVDFLLDAGANPNVTFDRYPLRFSALWFAVDQKNKTMVRKLLSHGANPNAAVGKDGFILLTALLGGDDELVQLLLQKLADANAPKSSAENPFRVVWATGETSDF